MSASHYVFKAHPYICDIAEDEYRKSKGLCPRSDVHVGMTELSKFAQCSSVIKVFYANPDNSELLQLARVDDIPNSNFITGLYTEHDDQGGYDPRFTRLQASDTY